LFNPCLSHQFRDVQTKENLKLAVTREFNVTYEKPKRSDKATLVNDCGRMKHEVYTCYLAFI
jgi:hypothetical protein